MFELQESHIITEFKARMATMRRLMDDAGHIFRIQHAELQESHIATQYYALWAEGYPSGGDAFIQHLHSWFYPNKTQEEKNAFSEYADTCEREYWQSRQLRDRHFWARRIITQYRTDRIVFLHSFGSIFYTDAQLADCEALATKFGNNWHVGVIHSVAYRETGRKLSEMDRRAQLAMSKQS